MADEKDGHNFFGIHAAKPEIISPVELQKKSN
jgi:hypothetical protein